jgi:hypothetical protein
MLSVETTDKRQIGIICNQMYSLQDAKQPSTKTVEGYKGSFRQYANNNSANTLVVGDAFRYLFFCGYFFLWVFFQNKVNKLQADSALQADAQLHRGSTSNTNGLDVVDAAIRLQGNELQFNCVVQINAAIIRFRRE